MKKLIIAILAFALILWLVGCEVSNTNTTNTTNTSSTHNSKEKIESGIYIWTDEETGVQYIIYSYKSGYGGMGGITPRLNADGTLYTEEGK
jgi:maltose-binding protein MalE